MPFQVTLLKRLPLVSSRLVQVSHPFGMVNNHLVSTALVYPASRG